MRFRHKTTSSRVKHHRLNHGGFPNNSDRIMEFFPTILTELWSLLRTIPTGLWWFPKTIPTELCWFSPTIPKESFVWIAGGWREVRPIGRTDAVTPGNGRIRRIPEESFLILPVLLNIKKDSSGIPSLTKRNRGLPLRAAPQGGFALAPTHGYSDKWFLRNRLGNRHNR